MNDQMNLFGPADQHKQVRVEVEVKPPHWAIAFRSIAGPTNSRTSIAAIVPTDWARSDSMPSLTVGNLDPEDIVAAIRRGDILLTYTE